MRARQQTPQDGPLRRRLAMARRGTVREAEGHGQREDKGSDREAEGAGQGGNRGVGGHRVEGGPVLGGGAQRLAEHRGETQPGNLGQSRGARSRTSQAIGLQSPDRPQIPGTRPPFPYIYNTIMTKMHTWFLFATAEEFIKH